MNAIGLLAAIAIALVGGRGAVAAEATPAIGGVALASTATLDAAVLNARIEAARTVDVARPISLALYLVGGVEETPRVTIEMASEADADFNRVIVIVTRDGFQDDSVRGDWHELLMERGPTGDWAMVAGRMAIRC